MLPHIARKGTTPKVPRTNVIATHNFLPRSERNLEATLGRISGQEGQIEDVEQKLSRSLAQNTELTREVHQLTKLIHEMVSAA